jgi:hypothetical protein
MAEKDKKEVRQLTVKVPAKWHTELVKIAGSEMASTGEEVSMTDLIIRSLDKSYGLVKKTGETAGSNGD